MTSLNLCLNVTLTTDERPLRFHALLDIFGFSKVIDSERRYSQWVQEGTCINSMESSGNLYPVLQEMTRSLTSAKQPEGMMMLSLHQYIQYAWSCF